MLLVWIGAIPFEYLVVQLTGLSIYMFLTPAAIATGVLTCFTRPVIGKYEAAFWVASVIPTIAVLWSLATTDASDIAVRYAIAVVGLSLVMLSAGRVGAISARELTIITQYLVVISAFSAFAGLLWGDPGWRLSLGGDVRILADVYSLTVVLAVIQALQLDRRGNRHALFWWACVVFCSALLVATVSRGAIVAVIVSLAIGAAFQALWSKPSFGKLWRTIILAMGLIIILVSVGIAIDRYALDSRFWSRTLSAMDEPGGNPRWIVWRLLVEQWLDGNLFVGMGLGSVEVGLSSSAHRSAHSVFFDVLYQMGIVGGVLLLLPMLMIGMSAIHKRNFAALCLITFFLVTFATAGSMTNKRVWLVLGLVLLALKQGSRRERTTSASYTSLVINRQSGVSV
jgi:hypothetical protein